MSERRVNFGMAAHEYTTWNSVFPHEVMEHITSAGVVLQNANVLDLGCGSGVACRMFANQGAKVTGIDPSPELIAEAKQYGETTSPNIQYIVAPAEQIPLPERTFDVVTAVRAWHWFDRSRVISEVRRVSKANAWLVVMDSGFITAKSAVAKRTSELILALSGKDTLVAGTKAKATQYRNGFPVEWFDEWEDAGFQFVGDWAFEYHVPFSHEGWRGRVQALSAVLPLPAEKKKELDDQLSELLQREFRAEPLVIPHRCHGVILRAHA